MTSDNPFADDPDLEARVESYLGAEEMWEPLDTDVEDFLVAAIAQEAQQASGPSSVESNVVDLSSRRRRIGQVVLGVAAAALLVAAVAGLVANADDSVQLALVGTELAPDARADARIEETEIGTRLLLDVSGLEPPADGFYYEAWLRTGPDVGVSAGTFHMRGGDGSIELWAGVLLEDYPLVTVTLQEEAAEASSGVVVLKALFEG